MLVAALRLTHLLLRRHGRLHGRLVQRLGGDEGGAVPGTGDPLGRHVRGVATTVEPTADLQPPGSSASSRTPTRTPHPIVNPPPVTRARRIGSRPRPDKLVIPCPKPPLLRRRRPPRLTAAQATPSPNCSGFPGRRRVGPPLRPRRSRVAPGRRFGARCPARSARRRPRLLHRRAPGRDAADRQGLGRVDLGDRPRVRHHRRSRRGLRLEITTFRAESYDRVSRNPVVAYGTSLDEDLKRRDFTINAMAVGLPDHQFTDPYGGLDDLAGRGDPYPGHAGRVLRRRPAADAAGRPVRRPAALHRRRRDVHLGDDRDGRPIWTGSPPSGSATSSTSCSAAPIRRRAAAAGRHRAGRALPAGADRAEDGDRRARPAQGRLRAHADVWRRRRPARRTAPTWSCGWPRCCTTWASRRPRRSGPDGRVSFHHHEVVGARRPRPADEGDEVPEGRDREVTALVALHLRFYGYGGASGPTRRCAAMSPTPVTLLPRLHKLTRSDCTTRNRRKAAQLAARLRRAGGSDRPDRGRGGPGPGSTRPGRQRDHGAARGAAGPPSGGPGRSRSNASSTARWTATPPRRSCCAGPAPRASSG